MMAQKVVLFVSILVLAGAGLASSRDFEGFALKPVGPSSLARLGSDVIFLLRENDTVELWKSDGTPEGTGAFVEFPQYQNGFILSQSEDTVFFITILGLSYQGGGGDVISTLWLTDGTKEGTVNLESGSAPYYSSSVPQGIRQPDPGSIDYHVIGREGVYYFVKSQRGLNHSNPRAELWCFKKRWGEPRMLHKVGDDTHVPLLALDKGVLFYALGNQVWATDGEAPPVLLIDFHDSSWYLPGAEETITGDSFFFINSDPDHGAELWIRDSGERMVKDIAPGPQSSHPEQFIPFNGMLYFTAATWDEGRELWRSDGTEAGTQMVVDISPGREDSSPSDLIVFDGYLYFMARGRELWRSDGTREGTVQFVPSITWSAADHADALKRNERNDLNRRMGEPNIYEMISWNGKSVYVADNRTGVPRLFVTDGTPEGAEELFADPRLKGIRSLLPLGAQFFFLATFHEQREEEIEDAVEHTLHRETVLYSSDGTRNGTAAILKWSRTDTEIHEKYDPDKPDLEMLQDMYHNIP